MSEAEAHDRRTRRHGPCRNRQIRLRYLSHHPADDGATGTVGPPLERIAMPYYLGGHLTNTPANMTRWIQHPQGIDPQNAMPDLGVGDQDAKDIAAYLYTLR